MTPQEHIQNLEAAVAALKKAQTEYDKAAALAADKLQALNDAKQHFKDASNGRSTKPDQAPKSLKPIAKRERKAAA